MSQHTFSFSGLVPAPPRPLDPEGVQLYRVQGELRFPRWITLAACCAVLAGGIVAAILLKGWESPWWWLLLLLPLVIFTWGAILIPRQVNNYAWGISDECFYVRKGAIFASVEALPLARVQYVEIDKGPLLSRWGLAKVTINTAAASDPSVKGLTVAHADQLRGTIMRLANDRLAGL